MGFLEAVAAKWISARPSPHHSMSAVDSWQFCAKLARQFMKGWGVNLGWDLRECKKALLIAIQALDAYADTSGISPDEWMLRYDHEDQLSTIYADEEAY